MQIQYRSSASVQCSNIRIGQVCDLGAVTVAWLLVSDVLVRVLKAHYVGSSFKHVFEAMVAIEYLHSYSLAIS